MNAWRAGCVARRTSGSEGGPGKRSGGNAATAPRFRPYFLKVRQDHRVVNMAVVIAVGLNAATGQREVLGVDIGPSEDGAFWLRFLRGLVARGLASVQLVISDSHQGLKGAIAAVLQGAGWQRCRTHFMRNAL